MKSVSFLFLLVSSLQKYAAFMTMNLNYHPIYYSYLQIQGSMVFKRVWDQDELNRTDVVTKLGWGLSVPESFISRVEVPRRYQQLGFGSNFLVNSFSTFMTLSIVLLVYRLLKVIKRKTMKNKRQYELSRLKIFKTFWHSLLVNSFEGNSLVLFSALLLQVLYFQTQTTFDMIGVSSMTISVIIIYHFYSNLFRLINKASSQNKQELLIAKYSTFVEDIKFNLHLFNRLEYRERNFTTFKQPWKNKLLKNYHFIGLVKKFLLVLITIVLDEYPLAQSILLIIIFSGQLALNLILRPFIISFVDKLKILSDCSDVVQLCLTLYVHVILDSLRTPNKQIEESKLEQIHKISSFLIYNMLLNHLIHILFNFQFIYFIYERSKI